MYLKILRILYIFIIKIEIPNTYILPGSWLSNAQLWIRIVVALIRMDTFGIEPTRMLIRCDTNASSAIRSTSTRLSLTSNPHFPLGHAGDWTLGLPHAGRWRHHYTRISLLWLLHWLGWTHWGLNPPACWSGRMPVLQMLVRRQVPDCHFLSAHTFCLDTLGIEPRASRMLSGCDTTTPCAHEIVVENDWGSMLSF